MVDPLAEVLELFGYTTDVAINDPVAGVLILVSTVLLAFTFVLFFGLAAGGLLEWIIPENLGRSPPQRGR